MKRKIILLAACLAVTVFSLVMAMLLFRESHPLGAFHPTLSREEALARVTAILQDVAIPVSDRRKTLRITADDELIGELYISSGASAANRSLRDSVPGFLWLATWKSPESGSGPASGSPRRRTSSEPAPGIEVEVRLDMHGNLLGLFAPAPDSLSLPSIDSASAQRLATTFVMTRTPFRGVRFKSERRIELPNRIDREVRFTATDTATGKQVEASVRIDGNAIREFSISRATAGLSGGREADFVRIVVIIFVFGGIGIAVLVMAIRRIRAYEMGAGYAYVLGVLAALLEAVTKATSVEAFGGWGTLLDLGLVPLLIGGAFALLWVIGESISRETFKEKFLSLDLISNGYPLHSRVGEDLAIGMAAGMLAVAFSLALTWVAEHLFTVWFAVEHQSALAVLSSGNRVIFGVADKLLNALFVLTFLVLCFLGVLKKRVSSSILLTLAGSAVLAITNPLDIEPEWTGILVSFVSSFLLMWALLRISVIAGAVALLLWHLSDAMLAMLVSGHPAFTQAGEGFLILGGGLFLLSCASVLTRDREVDVGTLAPDFAKRITERERLHHELEVARKVQMSFLPKEDPEVPGLDIASRCVPALEVGGDYYDFVPLGGDALGIAVGDVSGKGLQASFYMTLAKGFLRAVARGMRSPALVLKSANDLFSENVEKGTFISMVYGIADLGARIFTFSRAGHSLVIFKRAGLSKAELLRSTGMALGLERSDQFGLSLEEVRLAMQSGDLIIIYTDGFTEAMNSRREEFGEERLLEAVGRHALGSSREILEGIFGEVNAFVKKQEQHDDMTIVVIKWL